MLNFLGMLKAPEPQALYVATYTDGFNLRRREIAAPTRLAAYAIARVRPPEGCTLSHLRKKREGDSK